MPKERHLSSLTIKISWRNSPEGFSFPFLWLRFGDLGFLAISHNFLALESAGKYATLRQPHDWMMADVYGIKRRDGAVEWRMESGEWSVREWASGLERVFVCGACFPFGTFRWEREGARWNGRKGAGLPPGPLASGPWSLVPMVVVQLPTFSRAT